MNKTLGVAVCGLMDHARANTHSSYQMEQTAEEANAVRAFHRADRIMNSWVNNAKVELTGSGKDWLICGLDPFHDEQLKNLQGWPDVETAASTVRCVKQQLAFSATSGGGATPTSPWNADVVLWPWLTPISFAPTDFRSNNVVQQTQPPPVQNVIGGAQVFLSPLGTLDVLTVASPANNLGQIVIDPQFTQGASRVIGLGMELRDDTAVISRQGTLTSWKYATIPRDPTTYSWTRMTTPINFGTLSGVEFRYPPVDTAHAMLIPGTTTRNSEEGSYMVATFHSNENPPYAPCATVPMIMPPAFDESTSPTTAQLIFPVMQQTLATFPTIGNAVFTPPMMQLFPFHMCGIKITNANPLSSYNLTLKVFIERFPSLAELTEITIATPSAEFDAMALNIYSHAMSRMPVDVPVRMNPLGEWFQDLIETIGNWLTPLPGPIGAAGQVASSVAKVTGPILRPAPQGLDAAKPKAPAKAGAKTSAEIAASRAAKRARRKARKAAAAKQ